ncbi:hypothetical protein NITHO_6590002 [Nitrolancea hollandica Lb]|uniref:Uncharacterized protein n=1 Tax=Nitrolancea hollandica Lb TaxID=1129897 RepID=I4EMU5_9BACT|nr:hypothetical protein NITHO_6590002 [Nitrolancea hollandica Lb]
MDNYDWSVILALYISPYFVLKKIYLYHYVVSVVVN